MCPACVIGVVFVAQLLGIGRWFSRVILRHPVKDEELYWDPRIMLTSKMQAFASDKKKVLLTAIILAAEVAAAILIFRSGGFMFFKHLFTLLQ